MSLERIKELFTWPRAIAAAFLIVAGALTFVAGKVVGATSVAPTLVLHTGRLDALDAALAERTRLVDDRLGIITVSLATQEGYLRGIADKIGARPIPAPPPVAP